MLTAATAEREDPIMPVDTVPPSPISAARLPEGQGALVESGSNAVGSASGTGIGSALADFGRSCGRVDLDVTRDNTPAGAIKIA
ncbi:MAG: hypothetical protein RLY86_2514 [Pseudomonadota bacterium]|jgi:hypothetical protein